MATFNLWSQKKAGFAEYETLRATLPPEQLSFEEAMNWNDSALRLASLSLSPLPERSLEEKVRRVALLKRALAAYPR